MPTTLKITLHRESPLAGASDEVLVEEDDISDIALVEMVIGHGILAGEITPTNPNEPWPVNPGDKVIVEIGKAQMAFSVRSDCSLKLIAEEVTQC